MDQKINNNADNQIEFLKKITNTHTNRQLADALDTSPSTIQTWRHRGKVPEKIIERTQKNVKSGKVAFAELDVYDIEESMACGKLTKSTDTPRLTLSKQYLTEELNLQVHSAFMAKALGDSMYPTIKDGSIVIMKSLNNLTGDGVYLFWLNGQLMIKRIQTLPTKTIFMSDNDRAYQAWELTSNELQEVNFQIVGRVIWEGGKI